MHSTDNGKEQEETLSKTRMTCSHSDVDGHLGTKRKGRTSFICAVNSVYKLVPLVADAWIKHFVTMLT